MNVALLRIVVLMVLSAYSICSQIFSFVYRQPLVPFDIALVPFDIKNSDDPKQIKGNDDFINYNITVNLCICLQLFVYK